MTEQQTKIHKFSDGAITVNAPHKGHFSKVILSADSLMELILERNCHGLQSGVALDLFYMPYARQDRVFNYGDVHGLKVFAGLLNQLNFSRITSWDTHSPACELLINNLRVVPQHVFTELIRADIMASVDAIVSPDMGAVKKATESAYRLGKPLIIAHKTRDMTTGELTSCKILNPNPEHKTYLIVDDLCDGGGTFITLAKHLKAQGAEKIYLYVTHGLFSRGFDVFRGVIDTVIYTNSLEENATMPQLIYKEINHAA